MKGNFYYVEKQNLIKALNTLKTNESGILKNFNNNLGIIIRCLDNEYLITTSYISGEKSKSIPDYDFTK